MRRWTEHRQRRLAREARRGLPTAERFAWAVFEGPRGILTSRPFPCIATSCPHGRIGEGPVCWFPDGSRDAMCPDCGEDGFPLVDVGWEVATIRHIRLGISARHRRFLWQLKKQAARKHAAQRRAEYLAHIADQGRRHV